jgi:20S proteasome alpha/beta subunit
MTLIIGARCHNGIILAADQRRTAKYERRPETNKVFKLSSNVALVRAGDDAILNEARVFVGG